MAWWIIATIAAYMVKGIAGFASTLVFSTVLAFSHNNINITPVDLVLGLPTNFYLAWKDRKDILWKLCVPIIALLLVGIVPGMFILKNINVTIVKIIFGVAITLLSVQLLAQEMKRQKTYPSKLWRIAIGIMAGLLCGMFGISALVPVYVGRITEDSKTFRGTICFIFIVDNIIRGIMYAATGILTLDTLKVAAPMMPIMAVALAVGIFIRKKIDEKNIKKFIIVTIMLSGIAIVVSSLTNM